MFIIGIIDDTSRMIVGIDVFFNDNYVNFMSVLKNAVKNYGKPKVLNLEYMVTYNNQIHSSLKGISPITRFFDSGDEIIRIDERKLNEAFLLEIERKTSPDCVVKFIVISVLN